MVRSRLPRSNDVGQISLEQGRIVHEHARNLMPAAACAAVEKRSLYAKRMPEQSMSFLNHAKFGSPQWGSYVLTIISPVRPKISSGRDLPAEEPTNEPFEQQTMITLAEAVSALEIAARDAVAVE